MAEQEQSHSELLALRRVKLEQLYENGVNPYPFFFDVTATSEKLKNSTGLIAQTPDTAERVSLAGRVMTRRIMGKAAFFNLQDSHGTIQVYIRRDDVGVGKTTIRFSRKW